MSSTTAATLAMSAGSQLALGWLLADDDFGIYAIAVGISFFFDVVRDGGIGRSLARMTAADFQSAAPAAFWLSVMLSVLSGLALLAVTPLATALYGERILAVLLVIVAVSLPISAFRVVAFSALQVTARFSTLAKLEAASSILRYGAIVLFAILGFGPVSFVLPLLLTAGFEAVAGASVTKLRPWRQRPRVSDMVRILRSNGWAMFGTVFHHMQIRVSYAALGLVVSPATVGIYFFAYQATLQAIGLFTGAFQKVMLPSFAQAGEDRERQNRGLLRASGLVGIVATPVFGLGILVAEPVTRLLWGGKWDPAVGSIQVFLAVSPIILFGFLVENLLQARNDFRTWGFVTLAQSVVLGGMALVAGSIAGDARVTVIATTMSVAVLLVTSVELVVLAPKVGYSVWLFAKTAMGPYILGMGLAIGMLPATSLADNMPPLVGVIVVAGVYVTAVWVGNLLLFRSILADLRHLMSRTNGAGSVAD